MAMSVKDSIRQIEIRDAVFDVEIQSLNDEAHSLLVKSSSHWYTVQDTMKAQYTSIHHHVHHAKSPKDRAIPFRVLG